jgi:hypothetical protein
VKAGAHALLVGYFIVATHGMMVWRCNKHYAFLMEYFFKRLLRSYLAADARTGNDAFWFRLDEFSYVVT